MNDALFDWDDANISHLAEHEVFPEEAEEAILGEALDVGFDVVDGEERWSYVGATHEGRILRIVISMRGERIRLLTAFEPSKYQRNFCDDRSEDGKEQFEDSQIRNRGRRSQMVVCE